MASALVCMQCLRFRACEDYLRLCTLVANNKDLGCHEEVCRRKFGGVGWFKTRFGVLYLLLAIPFLTNV